MTRIFARTALATIFVLASAASTQAIGAETSLIETDTVQAPRGFTELCRRAPEFCPAERMAVGGELDRMAGALARRFGAEALAIHLPELTQARLDQLDEVNRVVNETIRPTADSGGDLWSFSAIAGDCEEYVLMKREMLARLGWPRSALRITVVHDGTGYHAVLVVETAQGGVVLDNMVDHLTRVEDSGYQFIVAQSADRPGEWVRVTN